MGTHDDGFTLQAMESLLHERKNWGRWGADDRVGAFNLVDDAKRESATRLVRTGRVFSLANELFVAEKRPDNPNPPNLVYEGHDDGGGTQLLRDVVSPLRCHGYHGTHIDALNHCWHASAGGMWNGRDPEVETAGDTVEWGDITPWAGTGLITRGVLVDIPRFRREPFVTQDRPVRDSELEAALAAQGVQLEPGDALVVYSGREAWVRSTEDGQYFHGLAGGIPGLHASCLRVLRDHDVAALCWDMLEAYPDEYGMGPSIHQAIWSFGIAIIDNCNLPALAEYCAEERRYEFLLMCAPLPIRGGTGSLVNPLALL